MKLLRTLFFIVLIFTCFCKISGQNSMIINTNSNTQRGIELAGINKLLFSTGNLVVEKTDLSSENILVSDIRKITFGTLSTVEYLNTDFSIYPNPASDYIVLKNTFSQKTEFSILSLDGRRIIQNCTHSDNETIDISILQKGIYLFVVNGHTTKLIKR